MDIFDKIVENIIKEQELIIGPVAWDEARKVKGIKIINPAVGEVVVEKNGDEREVINKLVSQYERLFGRASQEVCREAAATLIKGLAPADVPASLLA